MSKKTGLMPLAQEIDTHVRAVRQALRQSMEVEIARGGLTGPQVNVMQALVEKNGMSLKELSAAVGMAHSTVSGIVDRLEKRGMLVRQADATDRRFSKIVVSQIVQDYVRKEMPAIRLHPILKALRRAKPAERETIVEGFRTLRRVMERD
jgi:DNA-binding MarR family transcriptional regulator